MCCGQASHQHVCSSFSIPSPLLIFLSYSTKLLIERTFLGHFRELMGLPRIQSEEHLTPVPQGSASRHLVICRKWEKEKWRGELRQLNVLGFIYLYFFFFCLQHCHSLKLEQKVVWDDRVELHGSLLSGREGSAPTRRIILYGFVLCKVSIISQCIEPHTKFHVLLL